MLFGCEKDLYPENVVKEDAAKINYVTIDQVPFLIPKIQEFNHDYDYLTSTSKTTNKEALNLNLDLNKILEYVTANGLKSYSIKIKNQFEENDDKYFENLNIYDKEGELQSFILKYNSIEDDKDFNFSTFTGEIDLYDLDKVLVGIAQYENGVNKCIKIVIGHWHILDFGAGDIYAWNDGDIGGGGSESSSGTSSGTGSWGTGIETGSSGSGYPETGIENSGGGTGGSVPVTPNPVTQAEQWIYNLDSNITSFYSEQFFSLSNETQTLMINYIIQNNYNGAHLISARSFLKNLINNQNGAFVFLTSSSVQTQTSIFNYLIQNNFSQTSTIFANQCLNQMMQNPNVFTSLTPFIIEKNIDDSLLDDCTKGILNKLKQNYAIAKVIARFENTNTPFILKFSQVPNLVDDSGHSCLGTTSFAGNNEFNISLNSNYYNDTTSTHIGKAGTILHEVIHALVMSIYLNSSNTSLNGAEDFPSLWNYYLTDVKGEGTLTNDLQHHWLIAYRDVIQQALIEYSTLTNVVPPTGQSLTEFCNYLSWAGIYTGPNGINVPDTTLPMVDKFKVLFQKQAEMTNSPAPNGTNPSNNSSCN